MKYQTLQNSRCAVFKMLGGCWLLSGGVVGRDAFRNAESGAVLYVFSNEYIKGYGNEKYGKILCPSC